MIRPRFWLRVLAIALGVLLGLYAQAWLDGMDNAPDATQAFPDYHDIRIDEFPTRTNMRHVCTEGLVALVRKEADGDWHYRLVNAVGKAGFIVAEVSPRTPLPEPFKPHVGDLVRVCGTRMYDDGHRWWEVHPVEVGRVLKRGALGK